MVKDLYQLIKYHGVLTDEHLLWNKQVAQIKMRLNRAIGI